MAQDYPCSNRDKCRRYRNCDIDETPVRDSQKPDVPSNPPKLMQPLNEPPNLQNGEWDLQYCKWSGWTYVRKTDKELGSPPLFMAAPPPVVAGPPPEQKPKKKGCFCCCFKSKNPKPQNVPPNVPQRPVVVEVKPIEVSPNVDKTTSYKSIQKDSDAMDCFSRPPMYCNCNCCQICCPCTAQICCCMCDGEPQERRNCICAETQTEKNVKEQGTKCSELEIPKRKTCCPRKKICFCKCRRVCCPCRLNVCCKCCPCCTSDGCNNKKTISSTPQNSMNTDQIINYCLQRKERKPNVSDFLNYNSTNSSALHKTLDLLLTNNINIMNLFEDKKEMKYDKLDRFPLSRDTIYSLSSDNVRKQGDPEHCKLLTAVCDTILSNHKYDNIVFQPQQTFRYEPQESYNSYHNRGFLQKLLTNLNITKHNKDIGVQVNENYPKNNSSFQPKRSLTRLSRNKSRIIVAPRFPKRVEALRRNVDLLRFGCDRKRSVDKNIFKTSNDYSSVNKKLTFDFGSGKNTNKTTPESLKLENLESLLDSVEFINASSTGICGPQSSTDKEMSDEVLHSRLLQAMPPPFTDSEILLKLDNEPQ